MRGSILVPVLIVLVLMAYVAAEVGKDLASDYGGSAYLRGVLASGWPLDDAEDMARRTLEADMVFGKGSDHPHEAWARLEEDLDDMESGDGADLSGTITDLNGLFPINRLYSKNEPVTKLRVQYDAIFLRLVEGLKTAYGVEGSAQKYLDSIRYWMDDIIAPRDDGRWYDDQDPPYERPKRELAYPQELLLVHWEDVEAEDVRRIVLGEGGNPGLADLVTVWGSGKINLNTAPEPIVRAVCPDTGKAEVFWNAVRTYRNGSGNNFATTWYLGIADRLKIPLSLFPDHCLGVTSEAFAVRVGCRLGGILRRQFSVMERRTGKGVQVVFRQSY